MKIHLAHAGQPLPEHATILAVCGKAIDHATFAFMWDDLTTGDDWRKGLNRLRTCSQCMTNTQPFGRYIYGIVPGEEALQESA